MLQQARGRIHFRRKCIADSQGFQAQEERLGWKFLENQGKFMEISPERHGDAKTGRGVDPDKK